jgi:hypothetical protein
MDNSKTLNHQNAFNHQMTNEIKELYTLVEISSEKIFIPIFLLKSLTFSHFINTTVNTTN